MSIYAKDQPEPCLKPHCYSVGACSGFGYCRERNFTELGVPSAEQQTQLRATAARRKSDDPPV